MSANKVSKAIKVNQAKFIDYRFTDLSGRERHVTIPAVEKDDAFYAQGRTMDGSSFRGWQPIHQSDLCLIPDLNTLILDPFYQEKTLSLRCNIVDPKTQTPYALDPRSVALKAEAYLKASGIAEEALFGPEPEFFIFDDVRWQTGIQEAFYKINAEEAQWNSGEIIAGGNIGHRPGIKHGYCPLPPVDSAQDLRSSISLVLHNLGIEVEAHHHEVATANQGEVSTKFNHLTKKADEIQLLKYVVRNVAHQYGKTATFMPKPLVGDNGNGMHCHQSLSKGSKNLFAGHLYGGLSEMALHYIGGIIHHAKALNAFTNPTVNSYKRLVPGFEAPVMLAYSSLNRSAAIRIPHVDTPKATRIEVRFPDPSANPYLAFTAMLMAGLDGIAKKMDPGAAIDKDLYQLSSQEQVGVPKVAASLEQAIAHLEQDHAFLLQGDVFSKALIDAHIRLRKAEIDQLRQLVHPAEFELYYSC